MKIKSVFKRCLALLTALTLVFSFSGSLAFAAEEELKWENIEQVYTSDVWTVAIRKDGRVLYAGPEANDFDSLDKAALSTWQNVERLLFDDYPCTVYGITSDGKVYTTADFDLSSWSSIVDIAIGSDYCAGLKKDGSVVLSSRKGSQSFLTDSVYSALTWKGISDIAFFGNELLGIKGGKLCYTGTEWMSHGGYYGASWGSEFELRQINDVVDLINFGSYVVGLRKDGSVLGFSSTWRGVESLYFASDSAFGLRKDGTVAAFTWDPYDDRIDQVCNWTNVCQLSLELYLPVALCHDGTVKAVQTYTDNGKTYSAGQWDVSSWRNIRQVCCGEDCTVGVRSDGRVEWTGGEYGTREGLEALSSWSDIVSVSVSDSHVVGLKKDGTLVACGDNEYGQCNVGGKQPVSSASGSFAKYVGMSMEDVLNDCGEYYNVYHPKDRNILDCFEIKTVDAPKKHEVYVYANSGASVERYFTAAHGAEVLEMARQDNFSLCIIMIKGEPKAGWICTEFLK